MTIGIVYNRATRCFRGPQADLMSDAEMGLIPQLVLSELSAHNADAVLIYADWDLLARCRAANITLALNLAEGFGEYNAHEHLVPCVLDYGCIPYTGADATNMLVVRDKLLTKRIMASVAVKTPRWRIIPDCLHADDAAGLPFPLILKPVREEASIGIRYDSVVLDRSHLLARLKDLIDTYRQPVLVEEYIVGREISIGVWGNTSLFALPPCEFIFDDGDELRQFRSFEYKWLQHQEHMLLPLDLEPALLDQMNRIAMNAHTVLGCRDYSRCDFRVARSGEPYFLEHNFNPGIGPNSHGLSNTFTRMAEFAGYSFGAMLMNIIRIASERHGLQ